jgi:hypothetical protein
MSFEKNNILLTLRAVLVKTPERNQIIPKHYNHVIDIHSLKISEDSGAESWLPPQNIWAVFFLEYVHDPEPCALPIFYSFVMPQAHGTREAETY